MSDETEGLRGEIRALHAPGLDRFYPKPECAGCDVDPDYGGSAPEWPCSTARLVYTEQEITDRREEHRAAYLARPRPKPSGSPFAGLVPTPWSERMMVQVEKPFSTFDLFAPRLKEQP